GATMVISQITEQYAGSLIPVSTNWNVVNAIKNYTADETRKKVLTVGEYFTNDTTGTLMVNSSYDVVTPMPLGLNWNASDIVLCGMNGGLQLTYGLDKASNVLTTGTFTITNVELVCRLITPSVQELQQLDSALRNGSQLKIETKLYKCVPMALTSATSQDLLINTTYLGSLNSIAMVTHDTASGFFNNSNIVKDWYININGLRYPQNKAITAGAETLYQLLSSQNALNSKLNYSVQPFQYYSWCSSGAFASGIPSNNSQLDVAFNYSSAPSGAVTYFILGYDAYVNINLIGVGIDPGPFQH
ncbi:hypothetical protein HDV01_002700, partial [Terramyces sp. JEL0728]